MTAAPGSTASARVRITVRPERATAAGGPLVPSTVTAKAAAAGTEAGSSLSLKFSRSVSPLTAAPVSRGGVVSGTGVGGVDGAPLCPPSVPLIRRSPMLIAVFQLVALELLKSRLSAMLHPLCPPESSSSLFVWLKQTVGFPAPVLSSTMAYVVFVASVAPAPAVKVLNAFSVREAGLLSTWRLESGWPEESVL